MSSLAWMFVRGAAPILVTAIAAAGFTSALLVWTNQRTTSRDRGRDRARMDRIERLAVNLAGEQSALRNECDFRAFVQRAWASDRDRVRSMFGLAEDPDGR